MSAADVSGLAGEWPADGLEHVGRCPACGGPRNHVLYRDITDRSYRSAPGRWSLFRCEGCGCAYLDPRPDDRTAHLAYRTYYNDAPSPPRSEPVDRWRRLRRALRNGYLNARYEYQLAPAAPIGRFLVPFAPRYRQLADAHVRHLRLPAGSPRLLDVGCGEGEFLSEMQSLGWSVEGIDPSSAAVAAAVARGVPARQAALDEGMLAEASLDAITFRLVFEHIREPVSALAKCRRALRPGGILWIATPSLSSEAHRLFGRNWIHLEPPRHAVVYSASGLARLLVRAGFDVLDLRPLRQARWSFRLSEALAQGLAPFDDPPPLSPRLALRAARADLKALRSAEAADIIVMIARAA